MHAVTFYSHQGGTGQTTALVNVAVDLALRGRKVLVVDFDLAKPALSTFDPLCPDTPRPGLVEFVSDYLHLNQAPALKEYVYRAKIDEENDCHLWVMPAGRGDDDYWRALARLDWQDLYAVRDGFLLMEDLKAQWRDVLQVDYVLIDAPSGITDLTGICTRQLADDVYFLVVPDGGSLAGTERVMQQVFTESMAEEPRRIDIHLATCKVPDLDGDELPGEFQLRVLQEPGWASIDEDDVPVGFNLSAEIPFDPVLLHGQQIVMTHRPGCRLAGKYRQLANDIVLGNCTQDREGAKAFLRHFQMNPEWFISVEEMDLGKTVERWFDSTHKLDRIIEHFTARKDEHDQFIDPDAARCDAEVLGQAASCLYRAGSYVRAAEVLDQALEQSPSAPKLLWQRASYRLRRDDSGFAEDLLDLLGPPVTQTAEPSGMLSDDEFALLLEERIESAKRGGELDLPSSYLSGSHQLPELNTEPLRDDAEPLETVSDIDSYVVSAARLLKRKAPHRLQEALQRTRFHNLSQADRDQVLSDEPPRLLRQGPDSLIRAKQFHEVINRLEPVVRGSRKQDFDSAFHLAMAYWAVGKEVEATQVSKNALIILLAKGKLPNFNKSPADMSYRQKIALLAFRAGSLAGANMLAFRLVGDLSEQFQGKQFFSYWRYRRVRFTQFREDCRDLHQMIRQRIAGTPYPLPPFLPRPPSSGARSCMSESSADHT